MEAHGESKEELGLGIGTLSNQTSQDSNEFGTRAPGSRPACFQTTFQELLFTVIATLTVGTNSFVVGGVTVISTFVARDLNMTTAQVSWIAASSGLANGAFLLGFGRLCDLFGCKSILVGSLFVFTVLLIGAGFLNNGIALDVLNGFLGLTSAAAIPASLGILGTAYEHPSKRKNYVFACFSAGNPLGFVFGCVIGGVATQVASWRATFWTLAVVYTVITLLAVFAVPVDTSKKSPLSRESVRKFDIPGISLTAGGIGMFSAALTEGPQAIDGWKTPYVIVLLVLGILCMVAFVFWEMRYKYPLIPMSVWKDRNFSLLTAILLLGFLSFPVALFWSALFFQRVWHYSPLATAVHLLPAAISGIIINIIAGLLLHKVSNKLLMGIGASAYTVACLLMALNKETSSYWSFYFPALVLIVVGADFQFNVCNMFIMSSRPNEEQSLGGGIIQTVVKLSQTVGFGIATAIFDWIQENPSSSNFHLGDGSQPYSAVFWYCTAAPAISIFLVPLLSLKTQGHRKIIEPGEAREEMNEKEGVNKLDGRLL